MAVWNVFAWEFPLWIRGVGVLSAVYDSSLFLILYRGLFGDIAVRGDVGDLVHGLRVQRSRSPVQGDVPTHGFRFQFPFEAWASPVGAILGVVGLGGFAWLDDDGRRSIVEVVVGGATPDLYWNEAHLFRYFFIR